VSYRSLFLRFVLILYPRLLLQLPNCSLHSGFPTEIFVCNSKVSVHPKTPHFIYFPMLDCVGAWTDESAANVAGGFSVLPTLHSSMFEAVHGDWLQHWYISWFISVTSVGLWYNRWDASLLYIYNHFWARRRKTVSDKVSLKILKQLLVINEHLSTN